MFMSLTLEHRVSLVDELLVEQAQLGTAVMRFSDWHDRQHDGEPQTAAPLQERFYKKLIPLGKPRSGEQYAFEVNLDQCTGCKACVVACHSLNGLDEHESWRDVGLMVSKLPKPYVQTVTTACHHCADPACANGCPVLAYEKDAETGIVRHLDDQCIGCAYCMMKCPYDVPKWNGKRGIVRKCDMCYQRLAVGEAPACVQACPSEAISIRIVNVEEVKQQSMQPGMRILPQAFPSNYTKPATRYISTRDVPLMAQDSGAGELKLEEAHWPLAWMLVLTQMAAGLFTAACILPPESGMKWVNWLAAPVLGIGIGLSVMHLGQPLRAWRCFLGLRKSWLSREIVVFGGFMKAAVLAALWPHGLTTGLAAMAGMAGVYCSVMVYADTQRLFWRINRTAWAFFGNALLMGSVGAAAVLSWGTPTEAAIHLAFAATLIRTLMFTRYWMSLQRALRDESDEQHRPARTMHALKRGVLMARAFLFTIATVTGLAGMMNAAGAAGIWATLSCLTTFAMQLLERHLFFVAVDAPRVVSGSGPQLHHPTP